MRIRLSPELNKGNGEATVLSPKECYDSLYTIDTPPSNIDETEIVRGKIRAELRPQKKERLARTQSPYDNFTIFKKQLHLPSSQKMKELLGPLDLIKEEYKEDLSRTNKEIQKLMSEITILSLSFDQIGKLRDHNNQELSESLAEAINVDGQDPKEILSILTQIRDLIGQDIDAKESEYCESPEELFELKEDITDELSDLLSHLSLLQKNKLGLSEIDREFQLASKKVNDFEIKIIEHLNSQLDALQNQGIDLTIDVFKDQHQENQANRVLADIKQQIEILNDQNRDLLRIKTEKRSLEIIKFRKQIAQNQQSIDLIQREIKNIKSLPNRIINFLTLQNPKAKRAVSELEKDIRSLEFENLQLEFEIRENEKKNRLLVKNISNRDMLRNSFSAKYLNILEKQELAEEQISKNYLSRIKNSNDLVNVNAKIENYEKLLEEAKKILAELKKTEEEFKNKRKFLLQSLATSLRRSISSTLNGAQNFIEREINNTKELIAERVSLLEQIELAEMSLNNEYETSPELFHISESAAFNLT